MRRVPGTKDGSVLAENLEGGTRPPPHLPKRRLLLRAPTGRCYALFPLSTSYIDIQFSVLRYCNSKVFILLVWHCLNYSFSVSVGSLNWTFLVLPSENFETRDQCYSWRNRALIYS